MIKVQGKEHNIPEAFESLYNLVKILRGPGGCPWDRKQTIHSIRMYILEEAYEVVDSVEAEDMDELCEELGDLLFMVLFMIRIAEEKTCFTLDDVLKMTKEKMIRRHPHVFGNMEVESAKEVIDNWKRIKKKEGKSRDRVSINMPALVAAYRHSGKIKSALGLSEKDRDNTIRYLIQKIKTLVEKLNPSDNKSDSLLGELLILVAILSREVGLNAEYLVREKIRTMVSQVE